MPQSYVKDEEKWQKAKEIVTKQYGKTEADGDAFYSLVMGVYKQARGTIHKEGRGTYYHHRRNGKDVKRTLEEGRTKAPEARKSLIMENVPLLDLDEELFLQQEQRNDIEKAIGATLAEKYPGGHWATIRGHHVYITKNGETAAETPLKGGKEDGQKSGTGGKDEAGSNTGDDRTGLPGGRSEGAGGKPELIKDAKTFHTAISAAKEGNPHGAFVALYDADEYEHKKLFLMGKDGAAGIAVTDDGDIVSVFKHPQKADEQGLKNVSDQLLMTALQNGGKKLDCFDGFLPRLYMKYGFEPVCRVKFDREYAPDGWNYERDGEPDVVFFKHNGDTESTIRGNQAAGFYEKYDPNKVPLVADYMAGLEMRDKAIEDHVEKSLTAESLDLTKGLGAELVSKYPGGHWVTMRGRHVYITKGGQIADETAPKKSGTRSAKGSVSTMPAKGKDYEYKGENVRVHDVSSKYVVYQRPNGKKLSTTLQTFSGKATPKGGADDENTPNPGKAQASSQTQAVGAADAAQGQSISQKGAIPDPRAASSQGDRAAIEQQGAAAKLPVTTPSTLSAIGGKVVAGIPKYQDMMQLYSNWQQEAENIPADGNGEKPRIYFKQQFAGMFAGDNTEVEQAQNQLYRRIDIDGKTAALVMLQDSPKFNAVQVGYVEVAPSMRKGRGIGTSALLHAIEESHARGYEGKIYLQSHTDSIPFYTKLGMNRVNSNGSVYFDWEPEEAQSFYQKATGKALADMSKAINTDPEQHTDFFKQLIAHEDSLYPDGLLVADLSAKVNTKAQGKYYTEPEEDKPLFDKNDNSGGDYGNADDNRP